MDMCMGQSISRVTLLARNFVKKETVQQLPPALLYKRMRTHALACMHAHRRAGRQTQQADAWQANVRLAGRRALGRQTCAWQADVRLAGRRALGRQACAWQADVRLQIGHSAVHET
eukprot:357500-Chlamydomonas_euryale.AAC.12